MSAAGSGEEERGEHTEEGGGTAHVRPCPRDPGPRPLLTTLGQEDFWSPSPREGTQRTLV